MVAVVAADELCTEHDGKAAHVGSEKGHRDEAAHVECQKGHLGKGEGKACKLRQQRWATTARQRMQAVRRANSARTAHGADCDTAATH